MSPPTVPRQTIMKAAEDLPESFKKVLTFLVDQSRLFVVEKEDVQKKEDFTGWVLQIYRELIKNEFARIIMQIVSCALNVKIVYMPEHDNICNIKHKKIYNKGFVDGVTFARVEQIIIAAKDYKNEGNRDRLKGLIIHEFCHFAVYETFFNEYDAFYSDDEVRKTQWNAAIQECKGNRSSGDLIDVAFDGCYKDEQSLQELVVRYFQYQIQYQNDDQKLSEFKGKFPKLCAICEDYVLRNFKVECEKIRVIREINQNVTNSKDSSYKFRAINCKVSFDDSKVTKIVRSNNTSLMANYIFYEFENTQHFKGKFVFLDATYLSDNENFKKFKFATQRRANCTFVIDCDFENFNAIETKLQIEIDKNVSSKSKIFFILLGQHQSFGLKTDFISESECNFDPCLVSDEFMKNTRINFQGQKMSLIDLISVENFHTLTALPSEKIYKERIPIGNQMELENIRDYVERSYLIKNQNNDNWEKFDDFINIFTKHKRVLVANEPGAGKSIESIKMYYRLKGDYPHDWIVHINLSRLVKVFEKEKDKFHTYSDAEKFRVLLCRSILNLNEFESELFEFLMKSERAFFNFDSLDEISPFYFSLVNNLTGMIFQKVPEQKIIIFTRPHLVKEMKEFEFVIAKIDDIEECARNKLISNILLRECDHKSEETRNHMKETVQSFLLKRNFNTPLLIRMVTEIASMDLLISDDLKLYEIYKYFFDNLDQLQGDQNRDVKAEKIRMKSRDMERYFQKRAIWNLFDYRLRTEIELCNIGKIKISKENFISFNDEFFGDIKDHDIEKLQRKGITTHSKSNSQDFGLIHASFNDFFIADFIISEIRSLAGKYGQWKYLLMEIFSMLISEDRLKNVIEFLKGSAVVAKCLKEFEVISQMIEDKIIQNGVNIMPVINFTVDSIARNDNIRKICRENELYSSMILFTDPFKTLEKLSKNKSQYLIYDIVLINRPYEIEDYLVHHKENCPINIIDILAQCGNEESFGFYVSQDVFAEYLNKLTLGHFKLGKIASMIETLKKGSGKFDRSFFLMAKNQNRIVIETFLNFYEELLEDCYFSDPQFSIFLSILILNKESDHERILKIIVKLANLNKKSVKDFFSSSELNLGFEWAWAIVKNINHVRSITTLEQFEKAINFYIEIFDNEKDGCYSDQQFKFWFRFISTLLDEQILDMFKIAVSRLADRCEKADAMLLRAVLMKSDNEGMTILQKVFLLNTTEKDQFTVFTLNIYENILSNDTAEIRDLFTNPKFFIKVLLLTHNNNTRIISSVLRYLKKAENETNSWLDLMISYSNCIGTNLIDSLLERNVLSFKENHPELPKFLIEMLQKGMNKQKISEVIYEIFSNEPLTKDQLAEVLNSLPLKDDKSESQINQILSYRDPKDKSTVIIAASRCQNQGRIEILMKMLESYSNTELFKNCLLATDSEGKSALFFLLRNHHQENYFPTLFDKIESYCENDMEKSDLVRGLIFSKDGSENIFHNTLYEDSIMSEEINKILEKLFKLLSRDEQKSLIFNGEGHHDSLLVKILKQSFGKSHFVLSLTLDEMFQDENLYHKVLKKLKRFSGYGGKSFVNEEIFSSAFMYYKIKGVENVTNDLHRLFTRSKSTYCYNLSIGNFQYFKQDHVIRHLTSEIKNDYNYYDENDKILMMNFIFMLNCNDYFELLKNVGMKIQNYDQSKRLTLFALIKSIKLKSGELEVFFEKNILGVSHFDLHLKENSHRFLHEFLDFIESMCTDQAEFRKFFALQLCKLKFIDENNIFHKILLDSEKSLRNSTMYFDIYETLKSKLEDMKVLNELHKQKNTYNQTPLELALRYTDFKKCMKFFSENLVETSMREFLEVNDLSHFLFINLFSTNETIHNDFESIIKPLQNYLEDSEINEMFKKACTKKYQGNENFIHVLFEFDLEMKADTVSIKYLSLLFDKMKDEFGKKYLTELILQENEDNLNPLQVIGALEPIMPYLELLEEQFDRETIRTLLSKSLGTDDSILHKTLKFKFPKEILRTFAFYKHYFRSYKPNEIIKILIKVFETSDFEGKKLIHFGDFQFSLLKIRQLDCYLQILTKNFRIFAWRKIKPIFYSVNKAGRNSLAIEDFEQLIRFVQTVKLMEFEFSGLLKVLFRIVDSVNFVPLFMEAKDYERYEVIELLKKYYHSDEWTRILVQKQEKSINFINGSHGKCSQKMKIIDLESKEYGYAMHELRRALENKLSDSDKSLGQQYNYQAYAIVIHEYGNDDERKYFLCLQAVCSVPREKLSNTRINKLGIKWEYDEEKEKFKKFNCNKENQKFSLNTIFKTCMAIKSDGQLVKVLVPIRIKQNMPFLLMDLFKGLSYRVLYN